MELKNLKVQFEGHRKFKENHMAAFSWQWEDEGTDAEKAGGEKHDVGGELEDAP
jgi:hypothetical protein